MSTILIVEDNQLNREVLSRRLERYDYRVITAVNGKEGVAKAQSEAPDLILMDLSLPVMDGWTATRQLKAAPATRSIPVVALTAHAMVGDREKAIQAGCDDFETKPIDFARLIAKIHLYLPEAASIPEEDRRPSVLVVDDNRMNCEVMSRRLEREGYAVTVVRSGAEALESVQHQNFDAVLLDVMMPDMNGLEVLSVLRTTHSLRDLPVIMVTAKEQSDDVVQALEMGANDYVTKPVNYPILIARIQTQLKLKHLQPAAVPVSAAVTAGRRSSPLLFSPPAAPVRPAASLQRAGLPPRANSPARPSAPVGLRDKPPAATVRTLSVRGRAEPPAQCQPSAPTRRGSPTPERDTLVNGVTLKDLPSLSGYEILGELGRGGMGVVYKARHERMNRVVALKVIDPEYLTSTAAIRRFYQEVQAAAQLSHPNIVLAYDAAQIGETHYFAMEYVEGVDLARFVRERGPLPAAEAANYIRQAALGLQHAHEKGMVHRDIKPSNLLVTQGSESAESRAVRPPSSAADIGTVKILDLGLALLHQPTKPSEVASSLTRDGRVVGTADYMAPEQWMNAHKVDIRADLYSLGCTFYYLLTGQVPFPGDEAMEKMLRHHLDQPVPMDHIRFDVPPKLSAIVNRLLAKKPEQRFQQPMELAEVLR